MRDLAGSTSRAQKCLHLHFNSYPLKTRAFSSPRVENRLILITGTLNTSLEELFFSLSNLSAAHTAVYQRMPMQAQMLLETE